MYLSKQLIFIFINKSFGVGFCLRDSNGNFLTAKTITATAILAPKEAMAWGSSSSYYSLGSATQHS